MLFTDNKSASLQILIYDSDLCGLLFAGALEDVELLGIGLRALKTLVGALEVVSSPEEPATSV